MLARISTPLRVATATSIVLCADSAFAGNWGENWGTMNWGESAAVPGVPGLGLIALSIALSATAAWVLRRRQTALGLPVLLVLLAVPLVVVAGTVTVPNTFVNGEVADADEVNANFDAVETEVNDNDSRITAVETESATAQSTADTAVTDAAAAQSTANAAATDAAAAQTTADAAAAGHTTDTTLDEAAVDGFVANNEYASEVDVAANTAAIAALGGSATGFEQCPDDLTVADHDTGLLWEKKTGTAAGDCDQVGEDCPGGLVCGVAFRCVKDCAAAPPNSFDCSDPHDVNNVYAWVGDPDGGLALGGGFLRRLNGTFDPDAASGCYASHCNWRLPKISELQSILLGPEAAPGQSATCNTPVPPGTEPVAMPLAAPCIDGGTSGEDFHRPGATASSLYWSTTRVDEFSLQNAWVADFNSGLVEPGFYVDRDGDGEIDRGSGLPDDVILGITDPIHVRAVRAGSCTN